MGSALPHSAGNSFCLQAGKVNIQLNRIPEKLQNRLLHQYRDFLTSNPPNVFLSFQQKVGTPQLQDEIAIEDQKAFVQNSGVSGVLDLQTLEGQIEIDKPEAFVGVDYFLRVVTALAAFQAGGLLFHAAGIIRGENGYLFAGHSGVGKTTVSRNSSQYDVLNDDLILFFPVGNNWEITSTPFYNPTQVKPKPGRAVIAGIYFLAQDTRVFLEPLSAGQALAEMLASVPVLTTIAEMEIGVLQRCRQILQATDNYRLHFLPDGSFWQVIEQKRV